MINAMDCDAVVLKCKSSEAVLCDKIKLPSYQAYTGKKGQVAAAAITEKSVP